MSFVEHTPKFAGKCPVSRDVIIAIFKFSRLRWWRDVGDIMTSKQWQSDGKGLESYDCYFHNIVIQRLLVNFLSENSASNSVHLPHSSMYATQVFSQNSLIHKLNTWLIITKPLLMDHLLQLFYFLFLLLFSYFLLVDFSQELSYVEMVLMGWVSSLIIEELAQVCLYA